MALQKTIRPDGGGEIVDAYCRVFMVIFTENTVRVIVSIYGDAAAYVSDPETYRLREEICKDAQELADYFGSHGTRAPMERAQDWLKDKIADFNGAIEV